MDIIAFIGMRGGSGKSQLSHALAQGFGLRGLSAQLCDTDDRDPFPDEKRAYVIRECKTVQALEERATFAKTTEKEGFLVIDGAGNRGPVDTLIARVADLVIVPFTSDGHAVQKVKEALKLFPDAYAVPNNWNTNAWAARTDTEIIEAVEKACPGRVLDTILHTHSINALLRPTFNGILLPSARVFCKLLTSQVLHLLGRDELGELIEADPEKPSAVG